MPDRTEPLLGFIARSAEPIGVAELIEQFRRLVAVFGFDVSTAGTWTGVGRAPRYRFFYNDWPKEWLDYYAEHDYFHRDFIVAEARRRMQPFVWSELDPRLFTSQPAAEFFAASRRFGWVDGFGVPIHGPGGYSGLVSLAARQMVSLTPVERALLETAARQLNERCRTEIGFGDGADGRADLSLREIECLKWVAGGKTDAEIGQLLEISGATAHFHIEQAKRKLGVATRVQAVALMVLHGVI